MAKSLYVGNLEWGTSEEELKEFFAPYGSVVYAKIVRDKDSGRSKGYGFVMMENADEAMENLNGKEFKGRSLKVNPSRSETR
jgi:RNA recognition motif-containing protein